MFVDSCPEVGFAHTPMTSARYYLTHSWTECDNDHTVLQSSAGLPHRLHFRSSSFTFKACVSMRVYSGCAGKHAAADMNNENRVWTQLPSSFFPPVPACWQEGQWLTSVQLSNYFIKSTFSKKIKIIHLFQIAWYKIQYFIVWAEPSFIHYTEGRD